MPKDALPIQICILLREKGKPPHTERDTTAKGLQYIADYTTLCGSKSNYAKEDLNTTSIQCGKKGAGNDIIARTLVNFPY